MGTANETVAVTDVASQAPNMMNFVGNLKAASQASDELTARWLEVWVRLGGMLGLSLAGYLNTLAI